jgi:hypothetical protein
VACGGINASSAAHLPASLIVETFWAHVITGFSTSETVIVCVHVAVLPEGSVAVHVMVVKPIG